MTASCKINVSEKFFMRMIDNENNHDDDDDYVRYHDYIGNDDVRYCENIGYNNDNNYHDTNDKDDINDINYNGIIIDGSNNGYGNNDNVHNANDYLKYKKKHLRYFYFYL